MKKAIIVQGGWDGHEPVQVAELFGNVLKKENFEVNIYDNLKVLEDAERLKSLDLIIPVWTMGEITQEQCTPVIEAVASGVGIAGCHGGMCDSFRGSVDWQFMTGGQWVSHPGGDGIEYVVNVKKGSSPLVEGIEDFTVKSEHYYLHIDPAIDVLASTRFPVIKWYHSSNGQVDMPVVWTKRWGHGRVFYSALGHHADVFDHPSAIEMMRRGFLWAAKGKEEAVTQGLSVEMFKNDAKMF